MRVLSRTPVRHHPSTRSTLLRSTRDVLVVAAVAALAVLAGHRVSAQPGLTVEATSAALTVAAAAVALAAAVLYGVAHRMTKDGRAAWIGAGLAVYSLFAIPATTIGSLFEGARAITGAARLSAHIMVVLMLLACAFTPLRRVRTHGVLLFAAALGVVAGAAGLARIDPARALVITGDASLRYTVTAVWLLAGLLIVWHALRLRVASGFRLGLGIVLLALAHGYRVSQEAPQPVELPGLTFLTVRLVAVLLVLAAAVQFVWWIFRGTEQATTEEGGPQRDVPERPGSRDVRRLDSARSIAQPSRRAAQ